MKRLEEQLKRIDGKSYKAYKDIQGIFSFEKYKLHMDYVQGDPFAAPSKIRITIPNNQQKIESEWLETTRRRVYVEDYIARVINKAISKNNIHVKGTGKSGLIAIDGPDQHIVDRTAVQLTHEELTICLTIGLPANGRKINGKEAEKLFFQALPLIMKQSAFSLQEKQLTEAMQLADQHDAIRKKMDEENWIAFIANGAILPRSSGISTKPMKDAIPFQSPEENEVSFSIPHLQAPMKGMAIKQGITLIVGGGFHGKSTLLEALEQGVYEHIAGDGREYVLTNPAAVKIRAEDGRSVSKVNISPFINDLPNKADTDHFTTENASGSTSQAANVMEALEAGATSLLIDEDTSATNFMIRDERMQQLVAKNKEPITPFVQKVKQLRDDLGISTVLVMGGSGDYFDIADEVIMMDQYVPVNVTSKALAIAEADQKEVLKEKDSSFGKWSDRVIQTESIKRKLGSKAKVQAKGKQTILIDKQSIDLSLVEQLIDVSQTRMIANVLKYMAFAENNKKTMQEWLDEIETLINQQGLQFTQKQKNKHPGDLARPRRFEIAAAINRLRGMTVESPGRK
ncbi:ABC-ATPase domain-containing protein [Halalkalibacillus halophilus]|uniref:ABC-ATPase domain-containing protein n=1 Tax=Halalkalibacillus halophilus TaxID=392827 RepID=UPI0004159EF5|nr:ABC-ATPase domain-containing protein [Halalkalibacillus halophilus]